MERKEFLGKLGGGIGLTCVACMMNACSKEEATTPTTPTTPALLSVNLSTQITAVGDFISDKGIIVVRTATGNVAASFIAFNNECPHRGNTVTFVKASNTFNCSLHNSNFNADGTRKDGPTPSGLIKKNLQVTGTTLSVVS
jgi:Rieske Fe-S protein